MKEPTYYEVPPGKIAGGKTDLVCTIDGDLAIVDWKSGKPPDPRYNPNGYPEWPLQTAAYRSGVPDVKRNMVIHLDTTKGKPIVFDYSDSYEQDLAAFHFLLSFWMNRNGNKLKHANVPWVFRCAPADSSQVDALVKYVKKRGLKNIVALTELEREAHTGYKRLDERLEKERLPLAAHLQYPRFDPSQVVPRVAEFSPDAVLVWGSARTAIPLIEALRAAGIRAGPRPVSHGNPGTRRQGCLDR